MGQEEDSFFSEAVIIHAQYLEKELRPQLLAYVPTVFLLESSWHPIISLIALLESSSS